MKKKIKVYEDEPESNLFLEHSLDAQNLLDPSHPIQRRSRVEVKVGPMQQGLDQDITMSIDERLHEDALRDVPPILPLSHQASLHLHPPPHLHLATDLHHPHPCSSIDSSLNSKPLASTSHQAIGSSASLSHKNKNKKKNNHKRLRVKDHDERWKREGEDESSDDPLRI